MNDMIGALVVLIAVGCTYLAQRSTIKSNRRVYSLLGGTASIMVAVEAIGRDQPGVAVLFALSAMVSLVLTVMDYLKPTKPDA